LFTELVVELLSISAEEFEVWDGMIGVLGMMFVRFLNGIDRSGGHDALVELLWKERK
jgi:hypothetical protein